MDENDLLARFGVTPVATDLPEVRRLIQSAIADRDRDSNESLKLLCIRLFSAGNPSDALLIYKAKTSSFDAACYIDIQLFVERGLRLPKRSSAKVVPPRRRRFSPCYRTATTPEILTALRRNSTSTRIGVTTVSRPNRLMQAISASGLELPVSRGRSSSLYPS